MFNKRGLDTDILRSKKLSYIIGDTTRRDLGIEREQYALLSRSVNVVIHNAWQVSFTRPLSDFVPNIQAIRHLIDFLRAGPFAAHGRFLFTSSFTVAQSWTPSDGYYPEEIVSDASFAVGTGYGESKYVAERILAKSGLQTTSFRVAQMCGGAPKGVWNTTEWVPVLLKSSIAIGRFPDMKGVVSWIPVNHAAAAIVEAALSIDEVLPRAANLVNLRPINCSILNDYLIAATKELLGVRLDTIPMKEWISIIERLSVNPNKETLKEIPAIKLLPFLSDISRRMTGNVYEGEKLLIANRGEIAVRIIRTAKKLGISTVAVYTPSDALSHHVSLADTAILLVEHTEKNEAEAEGHAYRDSQKIISVCLENGVTMLHPGYGFLSENVEFAKRVIGAGITWIGPSPELIRVMGQKHEARALAERAGVPILPGSEGVLDTVEEALEVARRVGYPVMLKATAGGGGIGMVICEDEETLQEKFEGAKTNAKICGPPNNMEYLKAVVDSDQFREGIYTTSFLNNFVFTPSVITVVRPGMESTIQDLPGRRLGHEIPRGGPMDNLAFSAANRLVGNPVSTEALEILILPAIPCELAFSVPTVVAITGKVVKARVNDNAVSLWTRLTVPGGAMLRMDVDLEVETAESGFRVYLAVRGGFPGVPLYLGSKSTSMGLGGYQGRPLLSGDQLALGTCGPTGLEDRNPRSLPLSLIPKYSSHWIIHVLSGPQDDDEFLTEAGRSEFYSTEWQVSPESSRLGIRLASTKKIRWARTTGGEGGAHPSNILDNGYVTGTVNMNGDTPVILTNDGPDMGGYISFCTIASADMWKLGQVQLGNTIRFKRVSWSSSQRLSAILEEWGDAVSAFMGETTSPSPSYQPWEDNVETDERLQPILFRVDRDGERITYRPAGDSAILVDFGDMKLDLVIRAQIQAYQEALVAKPPLGFRASSLPKSVVNLTIPGRRISFPIVLDDPWSKEALSRYMQTIRSSAVYLPSNIDYLARNNGIEVADALQRLVQTDWGAVGIAGPVAAIYPVESPGGYQLFGRTLPTWQTWGNGEDFSPEKPWLLQPFDQVLSSATEIQTLSLRPEQELFRDWSIEQQAKRLAQQVSVASDAAGDDSVTTLTSPLFASIRKIKCKSGDKISSADEVLIVLEAMKSDIPVKGGDSNVGKVVKNFGEGISEGEPVRLGDVLIVLSEETFIEPMA
ncbi:hypothetical protein H0H93_005208 [Arthromyces matolae]|nr:hypothetical protein H0H93_005208 [Arthromyces matolae]